MNEIISKIKSREAKIGVIGLGYVGLPLVLEFLSKGFHLLGIDVDKEKIELDEVKLLQLKKEDLDELIEEHPVIFQEIEEKISSYS